MRQSVWKRLVVWACLALSAVTILAATPGRASAAPPWDPDVNKSKGEDLEILVTTFGPSGDPAEWFGHAAITVRDRRLYQEVLYNYGMFHFDSTFLLKFIKGHLDFWVGPAPHLGTLRAYQRRGRSVHVQTLNLPPAKRLEIARFLANNVKPENRHYQYHHFYNNCSTPIRDLVDMGTGGQLKKHAQRPGRMTLRGHVHRHAQNALLDFGMMFVMSAIIDQPTRVWDEMFLPAEMEKEIDTFKYTTADGEQVPLLAKKEVFFESPRPPTPERGGPLWIWTTLAGLLGGLGAVGLALWFGTGTRASRVVFGLYQAWLGLMYGGAGALLVFMWGFSSHDVSFRNENLFLASPLLLLLVVFGLGIARGKNPRALTRAANVWYLASALAALGMILKLLPWFDQNNLYTITLMLPTLAGSALAMRLALKAQRPAEGAEPSPTVDGE